MKTAESKSKASQPKTDTPFFRKESGRPLFQSSQKPAPFFSKSPSYRGTIQAKLNIGQPNDTYEREADAMADKVVQHPVVHSPQPPPPVQAKCDACEKDELEKKEDLREHEEEEVQKKPIFESEGDPPEGNPVQRSPATTDTATASPAVEKSLASSKGGGSPLPKDTRKSMESSFGADFSNVKIHNDDKSVQMSKNLKAQAFTHGKDIYFNSGKYDTGSKKGQHLLAHELTHVVQQGGAVRKKAADPVSRQPVSRQPVSKPPISTVSPKIQRGVVDDVASHLLTGNDFLDFGVGVIAGMISWFGDIIGGFVDLFKEAFSGSIAAIVTLIGMALGLIIGIILTILFPQVMIPALLVVGIISGVISLVYFLYMMTRPGLTPYERGKYLGKAIVEGVLLLITVVEALRFVKILAQVGELAKGAGIMQKLRWAVTLLRFGNPVKVLEILSDIRDAEKTIDLLTTVKNVDKALELAQLAEGSKGIDTLLELLKMGGVTADDVIDLMKFSGMTLDDLKDFLKTRGIPVVDLKQLLGPLKVSVEDLKDLLSRPGVTVPDLKDVLGPPLNVAVADLKDMLRPGVSIADLKDLLGRPGVAVADLKDLLGPPLSVAVADLKDLLRPGVTAADLKDLLGRPGMTAAELKDLLTLADDTAQLKRLLTLVPTAADLKNYFSLAGGHGQGANLEALLIKASALGDTHRAEELLNIAAANSAKFAELAEALKKFKLTPPPGGTMRAPHGYSGVDFIHLQERHTYDFFNFAGKIKDKNTLWPPGTDLADRVEQALTALDKLKKRLKPFEKPEVTVPLPDGVIVQIGSNQANQIGQFFALPNAAKGLINFTKQEMLAFKKLLVP